MPIKPQSKASSENKTEEKYLNSFIVLWYARRWYVEIRMNVVYEKSWETISTGRKIKQR